MQISDRLTPQITTTDIRSLITYLVGFSSQLSESDLRELGDHFHELARACKAGPIDPPTYERSGNVVWL